MVRNEFSSDIEASTLPFQASKFSIMDLSLCISIMAMETFGFKTRLFEPPHLLIQLVRVLFGSAVPDLMASPLLSKDEFALLPSY